MRTAMARIRRQESDQWDPVDPGRRALLRSAVMATASLPRAASAADLDPFAPAEVAFAARLRGARAIAQALGMRRLRLGEATNASYRQFFADASAGSPFADLEMRLSRTRPAGIAILTTHPGLPVTPEGIRARYGSANWGDVRPELPTFYLAYPRAGGSMAFGFPRGTGTLHSIVLNWGRWT
ncbi:hypothetical protein ACLBX9_12115 [Methylobacterium sp. A49B]